jgi:ribosomal protein L12E/L44/L45/RPP1/RPP2
MIERIEVPFDQVAALEAAGWTVHSAHETGDITSNRAMVRDMNQARPSVIEAVRNADIHEAVENDMMTLVAVAADSAQRQRAAEADEQTQRDLDAAMADVIELLRRHRTRLGRRVCSVPDGKLARQMFGMLRSMSSEGGADNDPSWGE